MATLLVKNAELLAAFDDQRREIKNGGLFIRDNIIEQVGNTAELSATADQVIDLSDHIVLPGLINTHHHLYQTLTRAIAQDSNLFTWLKTLYPIWARLTDVGIHASTQLGLAELVLSGCTTSSDHLYLFPNDCTLDTQIRAAQEIGVRFHAARGSMSLGESKGGLPPDSVTQDEGVILHDCQRLIEAFHDDQRYAMTRIVLAPCSPFSVSPDLMRETADMARSYGVHMHTHLAETLDEEEFCLTHFGQRPVDFAESLGWTGADVWHAHCVQLNAQEIQHYGRTRTGVAHCPSSNMRLASGIAPVPALRTAGARVGLGVDGSASNDGSHLLAEARQALLLQRIAPSSYGNNQPGGRGGFAGDPAALSAREALELATRGGAEVLGRDDIGQLVAGKAADFIAIDLNRIGFSGAGHDPLAAMVLCQPAGVDWAVINGKIIVQQGQLTTIELEPLRRQHADISQRLLNGEI